MNFFNYCNKKQKVKKIFIDEKRVTKFVQKFVNFDNKKISSNFVFDYNAFDFKIFIEFKNFEKI